MKKLLFILMALPLLAATMVSCSDDDKDVPEVNIGITYSGATDVDGTLYTVQGDTISIDSVYCTPAEGTKPAMINDVAYVLDGRPLGISPVPPFSISLDTEGFPVGRHVLTLQMTVLQEGESVGTAWMPVPIAVVDTITDIPSGATPGGSATFTGKATTSN